MKWLRRVGIALAGLAVLAGLVALVVWARLGQEPDDFARAPAMDAAEAERVLRELGKAPVASAPGKVDPSDTRGGWGRKRPPTPVPLPTASSRPYRIALTERQVAAIVVRHVTAAAGGHFGDVRVAVRERDLFAAGRLRGSLLSGSIVSISAVPSARRGRLCLALNEARVGGQQVPSELLEELGARSGQKMPRTICMNARGLGLPGPVRSVRVAGGRVVIDGMR